VSALKNSQGHYIAVSFFQINTREYHRKDGPASINAQIQAYFLNGVRICALHNLNPEAPVLRRLVRKDPDAAWKRLRELGAEEEVKIAEAREKAAKVQARNTLREHAWLFVKYLKRNEINKILDEAEVSEVHEGGA
jgi:hypothetical protein